MKKFKTLYIVAILICSTIGASIIPSMIATNIPQSQEKINQDYVAAKVPYTGRLRLYVVEPESRWNMYNGQPYHFGFLGFAFNDDITVDGTYQDSITWTGDVSESNAMVIAAVFNSESHQGYANPPSGYPFTAYYTDAAAAATPGNTGYNTVNEDFTHTVLVEEGTATWCPYCPAMATALFNIYQSGDYPWYFVALVDDMNTQAAYRLRSEYNIYGFPSAFFDGGYQVYVGGSSNEGVYRSRIQTCGQREVPTLDLSVSVEYIGSGDLQIDVTINQATNSPPATPPAPSGEMIGNINVGYSYTASTTDPNNDNVWYWFDWDDGTNSGWIGPYPSGQTASASHTWSAADVYNVKVKAKDTSDVESAWSPVLPVTINAPVTEIGITGGLLKVSASVKNIGTEVLTNISWSISVTGGILGIINVQTNDIIDTLAVGDETSVKTTGVIFGLGKINIEATVGASTQTAEGFVFGPFISIK